jgi:hypothetical protein
MVAPAPTPCRHNAQLTPSVEEAAGSDGGTGVRQQAERATVFDHAPWHSG